MDYQNVKVSVLELHNASGTVCSLECYYKMAESDEPKRSEGTGKFPLGKSKSLNLDDLEIPNGAWVTAYANVRSGKDSHGETWFLYEKGVGTRASFEVTGTAFKTKVSYSGITDRYDTDLINGLKLSNQSGTVCALECLYKKNKDDEPQRIGETGNITVGLSKTLNLDELTLADGVWVTAFANVKAGRDERGKVWFQYKKGNKKTAEYTISGVINFTSLTFDKVSE